ncbi:MAG: hypothetical protein HRF50_09375 [Phycisphaerae bacterium]|jgi:hypothetical protein
MKLYSSGLLGFGLFSSVLAFDLKMDCKDVAAASLIDALWFGASIAVNQAIDAQQEQQQAEDQNNGGDNTGQTAPGVPGADGLNCWDVNGNGEPDAEEDVNADGVWDAYDCQGAAGPTGPAGAAGAAGPTGPPGEPGEVGADGLNCWDLDADGLADAIEDINGDGVLDAQDCQGAPGSDGQNGAPGQDATGAIAIAAVPASGELTTANSIRGIKFPPNASTMNVRVGTGRYNIPIDLSGIDTETLGRPLSSLTAADFAVFVTLETDANGPPGGSGVPLLLFAFYEVLELDAANQEALIQVKIRTISNVLANADFSFAAYIPGIR